MLVETTDQNRACKHHLRDNKQFLLIISASVPRAEAHVQHFLVVWGTTEYSVISLLQKLCRPKGDIIVRGMKL